MMENLFFSRKNHSFKERKLKNVILSKIPSVSDENIQTIFNSLDLNKQYFVKATRNPKKFLNMIVEEDVARPGECFSGQCLLIYGDFNPGRFEERNGERCFQEGRINQSSPAAAIKSVVFLEEGKRQKTELFLVIFEPMFSCG